MVVQHWRPENLWGHVAQILVLGYFDLDEKAWLMIFSRIVEGPIPRMEMTLKVTYCFYAVGQLGENRNNCCVFGLPSEMLRGAEKSTPASLAAGLFDCNA